MSKKSLWVSKMHNAMPMLNSLQNRKDITLKSCRPTTSAQSSKSEKLNFPSNSASDSRFYIPLLGTFVKKMFSLSLFSSFEAQLARNDSKKEENIFLQNRCCNSTYKTLKKSKLNALLRLVLQTFLYFKIELAFSVLTDKVSNTLSNIALL
jgi:hypothetical protein